MIVEFDVLSNSLLLSPRFDNPLLDVIVTSHHIGPSIRPGKLGRGIETFYQVPSSLL